MNESATLISANLQKGNIQVGKKGDREGPSLRTLHWCLSPILLPPLPRITANRLLQAIQLEKDSKLEYYAPPDVFYHEHYHNFHGRKKVHIFR